MAQQKMSVQLLDSAPPRIRFGDKTAAVNVLDRATLMQLELLLDQLEQAPPPLLLLDSALPHCFIAGADIREIEAVTNANEASQLVQQGQAICQRFHTLPSITIAIISGSCMGGGLELALACDYIIAVQHHATKLGLPEVKIGIHPGFGGCVRLPQRVGWPQAVTMITTGMAVDDKRANNIGLSDITCHAGAVDRAVALLQSRGKRSSTVPQPWWFRVWPVRQLFFILAERKMAQQFSHVDVATCYPALPAALKLLREIYGMNDGLALAREAESLAKLAESSACKHLIRCFFLGQSLKSKPANTTLPKQSTVAVYGAGIMGHGIAWVASKGGRVDLHDMAAAPLSRAMAALTKIDRSHGKRIEQLRPALDDSGLAQCGVVIEAVLESIEVKQALWQRIEPLVADDTLLLSNTSSLSISEQQQGVTHPERLAGLHFFNPAPKMPLVEIIAGEKTSSATIEKVRKLAISWGKFPVVVADQPGFLVNRCLLPYIGAAFTLLSAGESVQRIDSALKCYGMPMGALELADRIGLDICLHVGTQLEQAFGARMAVPDWLQTVVDDGILGKKSGAGFYNFTTKTPTINSAILHYFGGKKPAEKAFDANMEKGDASGMGNQQIVDRCLLPLITEALRCLQEKVVSSADQLDAAMIFGIGYPPFRGGPLHDFSNHHNHAELLLQAQHWQLDDTDILQQWIEQQKDKT
ncbi:MAG: 3-hydroxyacyl-CoA dehydrogenase NAD-binding domain-containing protein [Mariprofundales bacterium]